MAIVTNTATGTFAIAPGTIATSLTLQTGQGAEFPTPTGGQWTPLVAYTSSGASEIMKMIARVSDTLTVVRAQEGTTAYAFAIGDKVDVRVTAALLNNKLDTDVGGTVAGPVVFSAPVAASITGSSASCTGQAASAAAVSGAAVVTALGYTPANAAGGNISGNLVIAGNLDADTSGGFAVRVRAPATGPAVLQATDSTGATAWATLTWAGASLPAQSNSQTLVRVASGSTANSGLISWGAGTPGALDIGQIYLQTS